MRDLQPELVQAISQALLAAEENGELVISALTPEGPATAIADKVREVYASGAFTPDELLALSSLIHRATRDKRFYDREMPALVGYSAEEMASLGERMRSLIPR